MYDAALGAVSSRFRIFMDMNALLAPLLAVTLFCQVRQNPVTDDWEVLPGFALEVDTHGYELPTSIAFVPSPGSRPTDPLYFVTELGGTVKVVTNNRRIHTFIDGLTAVERIGPKGRKPGRLVEQGLAGICLDAKRGYVFVTFGYRDSTGTRRNGMIRYATAPRIFATRPSGEKRFSAMFSADTSAESHQVGGCQVDGDVVYVGVGDGEEPRQARKRTSSLGKILRMDVDGAPARGNPFAGEQARGAEPYVWALGLRNPFGIRVVEGRLFAADNGLHIDRFLEIKRGTDYLWDGSDWSIGTNALDVIAPSVSPVQLAYLESGTGLFPERFEGQFYAAFAGHPERAGPGYAGAKSVAMLSYDPATQRMRSGPALFLRFRGEGVQMPVGVAFGSDGLYFVPMLPGTNGVSAVLKVRHDPAREHRYIMGRTPQATTLIADKGCLGCHMLDDLGGEPGPALDQPELMRRVRARLESDAYVASIAALDTVSDTLVSRWRNARRDVLAAKGDDKMRRWLRYRIMNPRFDSPDAKMPDLGVTEYEATLLAAHLMDDEPELAGTAWSKAPRHWHAVVALLVGILIPVVGQRISRAKLKT